MRERAADKLVTVVRNIVNCTFKNGFEQHLSYCAHCQLHWIYPSKVARAPELNTVKACASTERAEGKKKAGPINWI